ncbi:hypothetical protein [Fodinicola feengrottensis]|uniref:hypothetical protein n=1 Tax=Fodinicola feengrottensis TaxID=435914 RepID=UPI0028BDEF97|nr:hypothetical protein [Fodinicola feengrottensis]
MLLAALTANRTGRMQDIVETTRPSRTTRRSVPTSPGCWWCRAGRAPARRPSPCTAPLTCSTRTTGS